MRAADMFKKGISQAEIARELGVCHQTVSDWHAAWREGGKRALRGAGRAGRPPKLKEDQLEKIERELLKGPKAHGYETDLWTVARIVEVIEETTGVRYHPGHAWRIVTEKLRWSCQRPARRAVERDEEQIANWVATRWPAIKKAPGAGVL
jgi:transposase